MRYILYATAGLMVYGTYRAIYADSLIPTLAMVLMLTVYGAILDFVEFYKMT